ncbi:MULTISPECIES: pseudouridine synthase [Duncaniella]|uniref:pseudouridine synthase n=1 Tax=Duncaniella TaxID=2518495 RepID=UPI0023F5969F|nr:MULTISPECIES: pseudouridine synthase [Duncaniella]MCX4284774.1 RNA-binding S4 domain-containing protein [Duncaniella dubosii]
MDSNEKKSKRPRIGVRPVSSDSAENLKNDFNTQEGNHQSDSQERYQGSYNSYGNNRPYQPRPYNNNRQGGYGNNRYSNNQGGYNRYNNNNNRYNNYQPRPMANPQLEGEPQSAAEGSVTNTAEGENAGGYQPRPQYNRYNQGGYNNNGNHYNNNRQGGYNNNRPQGGYNNRQGGYSNNRQGGYNNNRQGGYNNNRPQGGYNNNRPQGGYNNNGNHYNNNRQGGYNNNRQGGYNNNRPQGFKKPNPRQNQYGMPQGGRSFTPRPRRIEYEVPVPDPNEQIRLNKFMANAGLCSRREADEYIQQGLIKVNGEVVTELGTKISHNDVVEYNDKVVTLESKCYILLNKPKDCVTTSDDPNGRLTVMDLVKGACEERIYPVGRLDRNTTGVLLLTNDGDLASKLTHPKFVKKKIYHVWTDKDIAEEDMQRIADGIELEDGPIHADAISYATETDRNQAGIEIHSGRNRIVRRIFESLGYHVTKLDRVYFAGLTKKNLPRGRWRYLTQEEVNFLKMGSFE